MGSIDTETSRSTGFINPGYSSPAPGNPASPGYPVGVVAARLGVPKATLRSWSQRYSLGPDGHLRGKHRLYSESDITLLTEMLQMVQSGVSPASAAECVRMRWQRQAPGSTAVDAAQLSELAGQLDTWAMSELVNRSLDRRGVAATWNEVCRSAFASVAQRQVEGRCIDEEHALSWAVSGSLRRFVQNQSGLHEARIVLACTPGERHLLPLEALAAALAEESTGVRMLGSDVPIPALSDALERTRPVALALWSHTSETADPTAIDVGLRFAGSVYAAGPGWAERVVPDVVGRLENIEDACKTLAATASLVRP